MRPFCSVHRCAARWVSRLLIAALFASAPSCSGAGSARRGPDGSPRALRPLRPDTLAANGAERDCDLLHVDLALEVDLEARSIAGVVQHTIAALVDDTRTIALHGVGLEIDACLDAASGAPLAFDVAEPLITIELARPLDRGERATVELHYRAQPKRGLYFRSGSKHHDGDAPQAWSHGQEEDNRYWIPIWDLPNDRATVAARITVDAGLTALSNGELVDVSPVEDHAADGADGAQDAGESAARRTFHWRLEQTIPTYLIAIAIGSWEHYEDFGGGVPLDYWVGPGTGEERARRAMGETPAILDYFVELLDEPFPYPRYGQVAVDGFPYAGMENAGLTILSDYVVGDEHEVADLDGDPRLLLAHEAAHQWFGDLVTCFGWSHLWLNEAWASYLELCYEGHVAGLDSKRLWLERYREIYLLRGVGTRQPLAESWRVQASDVRTHHEYDKGPWVLYMLNQRLGDGVFWQGVRAYLDWHREGLVTTADFQRAFFDATGRNIEAHLEQWVEGGGHPIFGVRFDRKAAERGRGPLVLDVRQTQRVDELVPLFVVDVAVDLVFADGGRDRHVLRIDAERQSFELPLSGPLVDVVFDAECALLCEIELDKGRAMWLRQASDDTNAALRWRALRALGPLAGGHDGRAVRAHFAQVLTADPEPILRLLATRLAAYPELVPVLCRALERDPDPRVRRAAVSSLAGSPLDPQTLEFLRERRKTESSPAVGAAIESLLEAASSRARTTVRLRRDAARPCELAEDDFDRVPARAAGSLTGVGGA